MPDIFINYRTGDEEASAKLIERELVPRFGSDAIFLASRSIPPGEDFTRALLTNVRKSEVLLAVIGPRWLTAVDQHGRNRLHDEADWTRREILEAFEHGVRVVPVLIGDTQRLRRSDLPPELATLADRQYHRLNHRSAEADLHALGDKLAALVPSLVDLDQPKEAPEPAANGGRDSTTLQAGDHARQQTGGANTVVNNARGPVYTGTGNQFTGDGVNYVTGSNSGGIRQTFGSGRERSDDER